jgi:hypothetical protein
MPYDLNIPGWMKEADLKVIEKLARQVPTKGTIVDVGSFLGRSTVAWASSAPSATVHCIDKWPTKGWFESPNLSGNPVPAGDLGLYTGSYKGTFCKLTGLCENIVPHQGSSTSPTWSLDNLDLVFLDAAQTLTGLSAELRFWYPRVRPGGLLCGHDFTSAKRLIDVARAVMLFAFPYRFNVFGPGGSTIWMLFRDGTHQCSWWPE